MATLVPAILAQSKEEFKEKLDFLSPHFDMVQIDIMDGDFVENTTYYNLEEIIKMDPQTQFELHLMAGNPLALINDWKDLDFVERILFHKESVKTKEQIYDIIGEVLSSGKEVGIVINPETSIDEIQEFIPKINMVQVMGGQPGKSGQPFDETMLDKIKGLRTLSKELHIGVDVGVSKETWQEIVDAGADTLASASMVFNQATIQDVLMLKQQIKNYA